MLTVAGVEHTLDGYGHAELFEQLLSVNGTVDVLVDAWLPTGHAGFLSGYTAGVDYVVAGTLYVPLRRRGGVVCRHTTVLSRINTRFV